MKPSVRRIRGHQSRLGFFVGLLGLFLLVGLGSVIHNQREDRNWWIPPFDAIARKHILHQSSTRTDPTSSKSVDDPQTLWLFHLPLECDERPRSRQTILDRIDSIFARLAADEGVRLISTLPARDWQEFSLDLSVCQPEDTTSRFLLTIQDFGPDEVQAEGEFPTIVSAVILRASEQGQQPLAHATAKSIQREQLLPNSLPASSLTNFYFTTSPDHQESRKAAEHLELRVHRNATSWVPTATGLLTYRPLFSSCSDVQLIFPNIVDKNAPDRMLAAPTYPKFFSGTRTLHSFKNLALLETTLAFSYTTMNSAKRHSGERAAHLWIRAILEDPKARVPDALEFELFLFYEQFIQALAPLIANKMF